MKVGCIGYGNMGRAMVSSMLSQPDIELKVSSRRLPDLPCFTTTNNLELMDVDILILAVKPKDYPKVLVELTGFNGIFIAIAPGFSLGQLHEYSLEGPLVRAMPNMPAQIAEGMTAYCDEGLTDQEREKVEKVLTCFGRVACVKEEQMEVVIGLAGSSPAYIYVLIEAMADVGVSQGLSRALAYELASQAVLGSAKMVQTGQHPALLKDAVCSPGGTTAAGLLELEKMGFRTSIQQAILACIDKVRS